MNLDGIMFGPVLRTSLGHNKRFFSPLGIDGITLQVINPTGSSGTRFKSLETLITQRNCMVSDSDFFALGFEIFGGDLGR